MLMTMPKNNHYAASEMEVTWSANRGTITFSRIIYGTLAHFDMKCAPDQLAQRLERASKMSDEDFKYIHDLNNEKGE